MNHAAPKAHRSKESAAHAPGVSVLMAAYNCAPYLPAALDSVLSQTLTDFELVVVDDASTDETPAILSAYAHRDPRLVQLHNERNLKLAGSLNRGLAFCRAPLIARADGDDLCHPRRLEAQKAFLDQHPQIGAVSCCFNRVDGEGKLLDLQNLPLRNGAIKFRLLWESSLCHASALYRKQLVREVGGYDESYATAQDYDLWARLMDRTEFGNLEDYLLTVRVHRASSSATHGVEQSRLASGVSRRLFSRYLGRNLEAREAVAARKLLCAYEALNQDELSPALRVLDELLARAKRQEDFRTLRWAKREICSSLLKQAYYLTYRDPAGSWELLRRTAAMSLLRVFSPTVSAQLVRLLSAKWRHSAPRFG